MPSPGRRCAIRVSRRSSARPTDTPYSPPWPRVPSGWGGVDGKREVFERGAKIGYCDLSQATIGLALGGQTYTEIIAFENKAALDSFKGGNVKFAGQASAVGLKAGSGVDAEYRDGVHVLTVGEQGLMLEASIGGQTFTFQPL